MRKCFPYVVVFLALPVAVSAQNNPPSAGQSPPATASAPAPVTRITLDEAIHLALQHNHALQAIRSTILQSQAMETTANLRPNPVLTLDAQYLPIFEPDQFSSDYINNSAQFDAGISYLFERGKKRQHRLQAARDVTTVVRSQVNDSQRTLAYNVAQQFISVLLAESTLQFAQQDLEGFQKTVDISKEQYQAGGMSEGDYLKIKLQLLQFQTDVSSAQVARVQALAALRQLLGFESVPDNYDVQGDLEYQPVHVGLDDLKALAARSRPDLLAAQQNVVAARSQELLAEANGKRDITATMNYTHAAGISSTAIYANMEIPIFDRNQGEIARTRYAITQAQEQASETSEQVLTDVVDAYQNLRTNDKIVQLYRSGYVDQAKQSRDISEYAYHRGAASLLDFLDAERTYRSNQLAYRQALANYMLAVEQVRDAVGTRNLP
jgi:outer membrane protein, heavy metal efflux system